MESENGEQIVEQRERVEQGELIEEQRELIKEVTDFITENLYWYHCVNVDSYDYLDEERSSMSIWINGYLDPLTILNAYNGVTFVDIIIKDDRIIISDTILGYIPFSILKERFSNLLLTDSYVNSDEPDVFVGCIDPDELYSGSDGSEETSKEI